MLECTSSERKNINREREPLYLSLATHHSLTQVWRLSEEGNTLGLDKKKTTTIGSASCCFLVLPICAHSIFEEVAGFSPLWFP